MTSDWQLKSLNDYAHHLASIKHLNPKNDCLDQLWQHNASDREIYHEAYEKIGYDMVLDKGEEDGSIQDILEPVSDNIEGNAEELTVEEHNTVFVGGKEKKEKKNTKEKDQSQEESNRAEDEFVQIDSSLSSPGGSPAAPGSPGGGPEHSPTHSASGHSGSNDGAGRNKVPSSGQDFESEPLDPLSFDNENDAGENRDGMILF
ncbi:hypothetical protein M422DRAFT_275583 [Sphaerobolus stellatus SS14]|uniref:Uncharacterized protein n=1 Tax=Sphaerobolus stellatus (strain SS14) TaxID=990650 RepID=A0A0C9U3R6_SPHS4|nr:hypothetical protein M422DRAFT_275583 [Sphaerobolus stellatus SS14]